LFQLSKNKGFKLIDKGGTIIGLNRDLLFEEGVELLSPGDKVLLYTDGVTEMKNQDNELYGTKRLHALVEKMKNEPVAEIVNAIKVSLDDFRKGVVPQDDTSIMCFEFNGEQNEPRNKRS